MNKIYLYCVKIIIKGVVRLNCGIPEPHICVKGCIPEFFATPVRAHGMMAEDIYCIVSAGVKFIHTSVCFKCRLNDLNMGGVCDNIFEMQNAKTTRGKICLKLCT